MFKKENFPTTLFVTASILAFIVFVLLFFVFSFVMIDKTNSDFKQGSVNNSTPNKYFLKDNNEMTDPMMTRVPTLKNMLAGPVINDVDPSMGPKDAPVNIVIYSDFKCDYCANQEKVVKNAMAVYKDKVRFIWKDYPEVDLTSPSFQASVAGRCAQAQGNFWNFHDLIFDRQRDISRENLYQIAKDLSFNMNDFKDCYENQTTRKLILDDMTEADALGITGIPFMYVNDQQLSGEVTFETLKKIIDTQLEKTQTNVK